MQHNLPCCLNLITKLRQQLFPANFSGLIKTVVIYSNEMNRNTNQKILKQNEVHLWLTEIDSSNTLKLENKYRPLLDKEEQNRYQRFHFSEHRHQFLISHALVRLALSQYQTIDPSEWVFKRNEHGRPEIANNITQPLRFNLSHTQGLTLCAITLGYDVGVDVESNQRIALDSDLEQTVLSGEEQDIYYQQPLEHRLSHFLKYWTFKEAYLKARGIGLAFSPNKISFDLTGLPPVAHFHKTLNDNPSDWNFISLSLPNNYIGAIAVRNCTQLQLVQQNDYWHLPI